MKYPLIIQCPKMPVLNTSWYGNPWADREAQQLVCDVLTAGPDGKALPTFQIVFPKCKIKRVTDLEERQTVYVRYNLASVPQAVWVVDAVTATSPALQATKIAVDYPEEPTIRGSFLSGSLISVLPVDSLRGTVILPGGRTGQVRSTLPSTTGRPVGLGLFQYNVDAVDMPGEVEWD
jgi:hypothetical protein